MSTTTALTASSRRLRSRLSTGSGRTQLTITGAQLLAGVGNLIVSLIAARLLEPGGYADVVAFLGLYLAVHVPGAALTASGAVDPEAARRHGRAAILAAVGLAAVVAAASPVVADATGLPVAMVLLLALALPGAAGLGLTRGQAYASRDVRAIAGSLVVEPVTRAGLGVLLMVQLRAAGAATAAVLGGYLAWWAASDRGLARTRLDAPPESLPDPSRHDPVRRRIARGVGVSFIGLAALQVTDLVIANARLGDIDAARFGALSTLGGAAVFATATVPLVLLPESARGDQDARRFALSMTLTIGLAIAIGGALIARPLLRLTAGPDLADAAPWLGFYLLAMAAIGVTRVLVATRWTTGDGPATGSLLAIAVLGQILAQLALGTTVAAVAVTTLAITTALASALTLSPTPRLATSPAAATPIGRLVGTERHASHRTLGVRSETLALVALCTVATVVRVVNPRGLWVDEAISVRQAQLPFGEMLTDLRVTDVHPPLHHALLWVTVRLFGTSELAVRLPSLVAGVALVPALLWVGRVVYDRRTGWLAAGFATIAPFLVWYSQEARMYTLFMLLATIAVGAQVQAIRRGRRSDWLLYAASSAALLWTQYFAVLPILVQQAAFAAVAVSRRRRRRDADGRFTRSWLASAGVIAALALPLLPILHDQFVAYTERRSDLVPGQAGAAGSAIEQTISVYSIGANLIWGVWGYHADGTMVQLTAFWPLLMLLVLGLLGRGRSRWTLLPGALVAVPLAALFAVGAYKRDLFELRYFSGAVPIALLLGARLVTVLARARRALALATALATVTLAAGLIDQQLNGANPRLYDFEGALAEIRDRADDEDVVLVYEPDYLGDVIDYYAGDLDRRQLGSDIPDDASTVWVLATENVLAERETAGRVGQVLAELEAEYGRATVFRRPNIRVWELR